MEWSKFWIYCYNILPNQSIWPTWVRYPAWNKLLRAYIAMLEAFDKSGGVHPLLRQHYHYTHIAWTLVANSYQLSSGSITYQKHVLLVESINRKALGSVTQSWSHSSMNTYIMNIQFLLTFSTQNEVKYVLWDDTCTMHITLFSCSIFILRQPSWIFVNASNHVANWNQKPGETNLNRNIIITFNLGDQDYKYGNLK